MKLSHNDIELHCALLNTGYTHIHYEEYCHDYGDGESGPMIHCSPAYDEYYSNQYRDGHRLIITENGIELDEYYDIVMEYYYCQFNDQLCDQLNNLETWF